ncbi:MAG: spermidine synthase [Hyphomicrobiaceae bacterium]|jgi:spermidine synthase
MKTVFLLLIFFLSGAAGLVYEVLWTRQLVLIFGVTTYAVSAVLATFMGGLALGSYLIGKRADQMTRPLLVYAALELGIGVYALGIGSILEALRPVHVALAQLDLPYSVFSFTRALLGASVLIIPTTLMGATFPVLIRHWAVEQRDVARGTGILYLANTGGAIVGCLLCGFVLIENLGLAGTNYFAAALNVVLAAGAASLGLRPSVAVAARSIQEREVVPISPAVGSLLLACAGLSGFVSLAAEVMWSRALLRYLYNSTYAFTTMLATFLLGITLGSAIYSAFFSQTRRPLWLFAGLQAGAGLGFALALVLFPLLRDLPSSFLGFGVVESFWASLGLMFGRAAIILLPPVICLGALFPLAATLYARSQGTVGQAVSRVYAVNTFGAILGSLGCAFVSIPLIGMWGTAQLVVILCFVGSGAVAVVASDTTFKKAAVAATAVFSIFVAWQTAPDDVFRKTFLAHENAKLVFYEEGATDSVGVMHYYGQRTIVYEDLRGTASTGTYGINFFLGHLPMLLHQGTPAHVLHICFGVGNSLAAVAGHDELERVDNVELSPHVVDAGKYFWTNDNVLDHPKVRTIIDDGRNFLMTTAEKYDVIVLEPPETFTAGVINLYTTEFYRDALERLKPGGLMMQWIPTANAPLEDEKRLFRSFSEVFPETTMWWQLTGGTALLVGTREPQVIDYQALRKHMQEPRVARDMKLSRVRDADHFLSFFVLDDEAFDEFVADSEPTTDDMTVLDFSMPRYGGSGFGLGQFNLEARGEKRNPFHFVRERKQLYFSMRRPIVPYLTNLQGESPDAIAARIVEARKVLLKALPISEEDWKAGNFFGAVSQ